ncbi:MAG: NADH-quinone oxidoreductase subunit NuoF [Bacteroidia bacterium]|nr:NADH-quinone oxidoreductase subunit NuoF [Bacteroidia bacterium]MDW8159540.1 NADH-quinone oxidoreductase subunit NuoF [Bacteroidia bacterium]
MIQEWRNYKKVILPDIPNLRDIDIYIKNGGYQAWKEVVGGKWERKEIIEMVKSANIRGRGGAGFNAGLKWSFMPPKKEGVPRYLACNGDESEPGTCKDRRIFEFNPHLFIEGALIACYAMEMDAAYVYIRGEYADWIDMMQAAIDQAYEKGFIGKNILGTGINIEMHIHKGAGAYICGEETSLMESLEGKRPYPRSKPPFPAQYGLWGKPTTINNIETLACVPLVIKNGPEWFKSIGAPDHPGPILYGISGHVNKPGVYEYPTGMKITDLIYEVAGGIRNGKKLKAVVPGGSSVPILRADEIEGITMNAASLAKVGTFLGTAGMCVLDEDTDIVKFLYRITRFYDHESCGQCTPCREGTGWLRKLVGRFMTGDATMRDLDLLLDLCDNMEGRTVCALADAAAWPVRNTILRFRQDFEKRVRPTAILVNA